MPKELQGDEIPKQPETSLDFLRRGEPQQVDTMTEPITGMEFVYVSKGCFMMGSNNGNHDEKPVHKVCVDDFWMGKYEVTQGQWEKLMKSNPSHFKKGNDYPVEQVSWGDAQEFIDKLNAQSGKNKNYRLPTEAEWEYACRASGSGKYCGGDDSDALAWYRSNSGGTTHPVEKKQANAFGLYDMSGNVWEWCADWYGANYYSSSSQDNPTGPVSGSGRVVRGGSWLNLGGHVRSTYRYYRRSPVGQALPLRRLPPCLRSSVSRRRGSDPHFCSPAATYCLIQRTI